MYHYKAVVVRVIDGDTVVLDVDLGRRIWVREQPHRLFGINAPEMNTAEGKTAKTFLVGLLPTGAVVDIETHKDKLDKYGRWLATIWLPNTPHGESINEQLVLRGHAVHKTY